MFQQEERLFQIWYMDNFAEMNGPKSMLTMQWFIHKYIKNLNLSLFGIESLKEKMLPEVEQTKHKPLKLWLSQANVELKDVVATVNSVINTLMLFRNSLKHFGFVWY